MQKIIFIAVFCYQNCKQIEREITVFCKLRPQSKILLLSKAFWRWRAFLGTHANGNTLINNISLDLVKVGDDPDHVAASKNWRRKSGINRADFQLWWWAPATRRMRREAIFWFLFCLLLVFGQRNVDALGISDDVNNVICQFKDTVLMQLDSLRNATLMIFFQNPVAKTARSYTAPQLVQQ